jgi:hypothetical protein
MSFRLVFLAGVLVGGCHSSTATVEPPRRTAEQRSADAAAAYNELKAAKFDEAARDAQAAMALDPRNSTAAAIHAVSTYQSAMSDLITDLGKVLDEAGPMKLLDHPAGRAAWTKFADALANVDRDLAVVAADPSFTMELCLACWEHDWNHNGRIDDRDRHLFEIEYDPKANDQEIPEQDPRRRPTFKFDVGDAEWARAMIDFQRAFAELVLAYRWDELDKLAAAFERDPTGKLTLHLEDPGRVKHARTLILEGLAAAMRCRTAYLAETDDDREWVPNPKQKSHPIPLEADAALYETWAGVVSDVRDMLESKSGLSIRQVADLGDRKARDYVPDAYIDLGAMLREPKDIVLDLDALAHLDRDSRDPAKVSADVATLFRGLLGNGYVTKMPASPLVQRLGRMKTELDRGDETLEHKLRYLIWLN